MKADKSIQEKSLLNCYFDHVYVVNLKSEVANKLIIAKHLTLCNVDFEIYEATDGSQGETFGRYKEYQKRSLGDLKRYPEYSKKEKRRGTAYIGSAGAMGYIYTYLNILDDAKKNGYNRFLILEDDVILSRNFESVFEDFMKRISEDWKILLLGASQYNWLSVDANKARKDGFYFPRSLDTCGSFAIAFDFNVIDELIDIQSAFESPFDLFSIGELYEKYEHQCFVAYPNIAMPDVRKSSIRGARSQYDHGKKMRWEINRFDFPLEKPSISIVVTSKVNLKYYENFSNTRKLPFTLKLFFNSKDGLRPLHSMDLLNFMNNEIIPLEKEVLNTDSDYSAIIDEGCVLTESGIVSFIENKINFAPEKITNLKEIKTHQVMVKKDRVSVIIPTYKRIDTIKNALNSVVLQEYHDVEIIVVSDNGRESEYNAEVKNIIDTLSYSKETCKIKFIEHSISRNGSSARNTGFINSTGEYICFLDDDDIYLQGRLSKCVKKLKESKKTVGAIYCGFVGWNSPENDFKRYKEGDLTLEILLLEYKKHYLCTNTATYKREAVSKINGFDESYSRHQDLEYNLRFFEHYTIEAIHEVLVQLNPEPSKINNKVYGLNMLKLKQKFLNDFSHIIEKYDVKMERQIYEKHWEEANKYISNPNDLFIDDGRAYKEGVFQVLLSSQKNFKDVYEGYKIADNYKLIMKKIFDLTKVSVLRKPLKKYSYYKSLLRAYRLIKNKN